MYDIYPLSNNTITSEIVAFINNKTNSDLIADIENTKNLTSEMLRDINNNAKIHITGPLKAEKYKKERYFKRNTYTMRELKEIIKIMEGIEKTLILNGMKCKKPYIFIIL